MIRPTNPSTGELYRHEARAMNNNSVGSATKGLIPEASEKFRFLVAEHGFRQENDIAHWGTSVTFHGELWSLYLFYGNPEFDFIAEIKYHRFPRKNPRPLWAVLEAMGIDCPALAPETMTEARLLGRLVAATAEAITGHWDVLSRVPTLELFREVDRVLDRSARRVRSVELSGNNT
jgi:hypothetical protein